MQEKSREDEWRKRYISRVKNSRIELFFTPLAGICVKRDNQQSIHLSEVMRMTIKSIVIINGEEVEIKDLENKEDFADSINKRVLSERNYIIEKPA